MTVYIEEIGPNRLSEYTQIGIAYEVDSILQVELLEDGLRGMTLKETPVETYVKDYDACEDAGPMTWPQKFDVTHWGFFLATFEYEPIGAAAVTFNTNGVNLLEGRGDLSILWDIRVIPEERGQGVGTALFRHAAAWSYRHGCKLMKAETQNINTKACRFYARVGCVLGDICRYAYTDQSHVAHEIQLNWYLEL